MSETFFWRNLEAHDPQFWQMFEMEHFTNELNISSWVLCLFYFSYMQNHSHRSKRENTFTQTCYESCECNSMLNRALVIKDNNFFFLNWDIKKC